MTTETKTQETAPAAEESSFWGDISKVFCVQIYQINSYAFFLFLYFASSLITNPNSLSFLFVTLLRSYVKGFEDFGKSVTEAAEKVQHDIDENNAVIAKNFEDLGHQIEENNAKIAQDFEEMGKNIQESADKVIHDLQEESNKSAAPPAPLPQFPIFDIPGEFLDKYFFEPRHKWHMSEASTADANTQFLVDSGVLNIPETHYLNIPKVILFGISALAGKNYHIYIYIYIYMLLCP